MEIRIVIFLAFVSVTVITNTLLMIFAYRAFSGATSKLARTVSELRTSGETRELVDSLQLAAQRAAVFTESAKLKIAGFEPVLDRTVESYRRTLSVVDSKFEKVADNINTTAKKVRDGIARPTLAAASVAAGLTKAFEGGTASDPSSHVRPNGRGRGV
jgi:hypothetical protein